MYYIEEYTYHSISQQLCMREQSVKNLVYKAKKELLDIINNEYDLFEEDTKKYIDLLFSK